MRINNKRVNVFVGAFYSLFLLGLFFSILLLIIPISQIVNRISPYLLIVIFISLIYLFYKSGHQNIEYNSDGEVLNIRTQDPFWVQYFPSQKTLTDFPKKKLTGFKIKKSIFSRKLELYLTSKRSQKGYVRLSFPITYLNKSEISDLKKSLNRIITKNKEAEKNEIN